jgi:hypothetical protein
MEENSNINIIGPDTNINVIISGGVRKERRRRRGKKRKSLYLKKDLN